ncbi:hypothetical protein GCM10010430_79850 [Kitasatospora cystarginea]|uniref:Uncharacterized protein n=1 Tax=Kitasatospora cystarginea TaxID=58350 RepID=A0ABN3F1Q3_9ACTN
MVAGSGSCSPLDQHDVGAGAACEAEKRHARAWAQSALLVGVSELEGEGGGAHVAGAGWGLRPLHEKNAVKGG